MTKWFFSRETLALALMLPVSSVAKSTRRKLYPKMIGRETPLKSEPLYVRPEGRGTLTAEPSATHVTSRCAIYQGTCAAGGEFRFRLGGGQGVGFVTGVASQALTVEDASSAVDVGSTTATSGDAVFGTMGPSLQFFYRDVPANGTEVSISCDNRTTAVLAIVRDTNPTTRAIEIDGDFITTSDLGTVGKLHLNQKAFSVTSVDAKSSLLWKDDSGSVRKLKGKPFKTPRSSDLLAWRAAQEADGGPGDLSIETAKSHDIVFATFDFVDESSGLHVPRTVVFETPEKVQPVQPFGMQEMDVSVDGHLDVKFNVSFAESKGASNYLVTARIAILPADAEHSSEVIHVAEYSSMIDPQYEHLVVHGAWIRNAADRLGNSTNLDDYMVDIAEAMIPTAQWLS